MSENENSKLTDHDYDGIQEYDNPLPTWWLATFFLTIIFAFLYYIHYFSGAGPTLLQEFDIAMKELEKGRPPVAQSLETEDELLAFRNKPEILAAGAAAYGGKCAVCHRADLGGQIGPNLTDEFWIHGKGHAVDIAKVVREGVADKGMPPWGDLLSKDELHGLVAYILTKKDSHPASAKAPQGEKAE